MTDSGATATDNGIVRFNIERLHLAEIRVLCLISALTYWDLTMGLDGLFYAATVDSKIIHVYDPTTLQFLKTINLYVGARNIAVDGVGEIFATTSDGAITHFGRGGQLLGRKPVANITDINISPTDQLVAGGAHSVYLSNTSLTTTTSLQAQLADSTFVSFVRYPQPGDVDADSKTGCE